MRTAVIVPAYNEEYTIGDVVKAIKALGEGYDAIVINDNSNDRTSGKASEAGATVIELPCNLGIGGAVQTGYKYAFMNGYDACVQVDGDGQHPAQGIPQLLKPLFEDGYDMVIGSRFVADTDYEISLMRSLGIRIISFFLKITTGMVVKDPTSGFRAINKKAIQLFALQYPQDYPEPESLVFAYKSHFKVLEVPIEMKNRMFGISSITPLLAVYYMGKVLLAMFIDLFKKL
ncbi:MAG: glycosyl transferase family 2 [Syntrophus sp. (in: bacteria)]|nr:glycosyl transferase family 2 [Syntrophus sp. (in: bacteria)]